MLNGTAPAWMCMGLDKDDPEESARGGLSGSGEGEGMKAIPRAWGV